MGSYIPSTKEERQEMLAAAGYGSIRSCLKTCLPKFTLISR